MSYTKTTWQNGVTPVNADNMNKIENELEALDTGKLDASKTAVATVGGLVTPTAVLTSNELVGVGTNGEQVRVQLGSGLTLSGSTSPYTLSASGGGGGDEEADNVTFNNLEANANGYNVTLSYPTAFSGKYILLTKESLIVPNQNDGKSYSYDNVIAIYIAVPAINFGQSGVCSGTLQFKNETVTLSKEYVIQGNIKRGYWYLVKSNITWTGGGF